MNSLYRSLSPLEIKEEIDYNIVTFSTEGTHIFPGVPVCFALQFVKQYSHLSVRARIS